MRAVVTGRRSLLAAAPALLLSRHATAQAYPDRPIRMVVAYSAGGGTDLMARAVAGKMTEMLGQSIVIENRAGGAGTVGTVSVAQARPDGYSLLFATGSEMSLKPLLEGNLPYNTDRDFTPVGRVGITPVVFAVHPSVPAETMAEFLALARARPGQMNVSNSGIGGIMHLTASAIAVKAGIEVTHVPYRGAALAVADAAAGVVEATVSGLPPVLAQAREGRLRILGVSTPSRSSAIPEVPTLAESGLAGFDMSNIVGIVVPRGTPEAIIARINAAANAAVADAEVRRIMVANGADPVGSTPAEHAALIAAERARLREVVQLTGLRME
jgi:tripartite-type tricarboxylate transporter receptor subunit TctC